MLGASGMRACTAPWSARPDRVGGADDEEAGVEQEVRHLAEATHELGLRGLAEVQIAVHTEEDVGAVEHVRVAALGEERPLEGARVAVLARAGAPHEHDERRAVAEAARAIRAGHAALDPVEVAQAAPRRAAPAARRARRPR
jgi:hypothetical protein